MLVLSRKIGESIVIGSSDDNMFELFVNDIDTDEERINVNIGLIRQTDESFIFGFGDRSARVEITMIQDNKARLTISLKGIARDEKFRFGLDEDKVFEITLISTREKDNIKKTRIGLLGPRDVSVHRREIYDAIQREKASTE